MKWSDEKVQQLRALASAGKPNKEIAQQLGVGINDVYAERSKLSITIDKIKIAQAAAAKPSPEAAQPKPSPAVDIEAQELDRKHALLDLLAPALGEADNSIVALGLAEDGRSVKIHYSNGAERTAFVEGDGLMAIIFDVVRKCLF